MKKILIISFSLIFLFIIIFAVFKFLRPDSGTQTITNFDECRQAGYPVMESWPARCKTPEGKTFTQDIGNELEKADLIKIKTPRPNDSIVNPLIIEGEARGSWFFEASFPVRLEDENGTEIGHGIALAQGEWMTENFVPFKAEISYIAANAKKGTLILQKDNPSGLPENDDDLRVPVLLAPTWTGTINLYYYNSRNDPDQSCSSDSLLPVSRNISLSQTPIQDAIKLLLKGELTEKEKLDGFNTEFPLNGVELKGANLKNGLLTLEFTDLQNKTIGGSCRVRLLWSQIEKTALQFPQVKKVLFIPEELFQP